MKKTFLLLSLLPIVAIASPSDHEPKQCESGHHHQMKHKRSGDMPFYLRDIDLNDSQKAQIRAMMEKRHEQRQADKDQFWQNKQAINDLTKAENLNEPELEKLVDQSMVMKKQAAMEKARFHHDVFNLLTAEQQQQLEAKLAEFKKKHH